METESPGNATTQAVGPRSTEDRCVNAIRALAMDAVERAASGHPGAPMGLAPAAFVLWTRLLKHNPANPAWPDRDRAILSAGHASMLLYSLLHLTGYDLPLAQLRRFRQWGSLTPGHPEHGLTPGVETTTGPLGQGFANGVGMAIAERVLAERFNRPGFAVVDHRTWVIASDGDMMEGLSHEAASLAGHLRLRKLAVIYDANGISIDGPTDLSFSEDIAKRFDAYGWRVAHVDDGNDLDAIDEALHRTMDGEGPTIVVLRTHIGYGAPTKQDSAQAHGSPLGADEVRGAKTFLGWPEEPAFFIPDEVRTFMRRSLVTGARAERAWRDLMHRYGAAHPDEAEQLGAALAGELPNEWDVDLPGFAPGDKPMATRQASAKAVAAIASTVPSMIGGSADLTESTGTAIPGEPVLSATTSGRFVHYGVREHAMAAAMNGIALHGGLRPFGGTFLVFSDYMRPAVRLAALMAVPTIFVFTHDSIGLGEDGPTHQPVEHLAALRAIPGLVVIRPADANETVGAWRVAMKRRTGPTALILSRQALPILNGTRFAPVERGAYVLRDAPAPTAGIVASGSEVWMSLEAAARLDAEGIDVTVVSMPSWELFELQDRAYRDEILPAAVPFLAVEAASPMGWERYAAATLCLERFGASAPGPMVTAELGFTVESVVERVRALAVSRSRVSALPPARAARTPLETTLAGNRTGTGAPVRSGGEL